MPCDLEGGFLHRDGIGSWGAFFHVLLHYSLILKWIKQIKNPQQSPHNTLNDIGKTDLQMQIYFEKIPEILHLHKYSDPLPSILLK
jgi:hypothetical protein